MYNLRIIVAIGWLWLKKKCIELFYSSELHKCPVCGRLAEPMYMTGECSDKCFNTSFWNHTLDDTAIIIDGKCYHIGPSSLGFKGSGGRKFTIQFNDGKVINTDNLWCNGDVPKEYNVKDNAVFL